jgi:lipopolysaccharide transport system ATP-binding protein
VPEGQVVAVIGHNGAGKTTLLKILSRITQPTEGEARVRGRVGALLEVAAGFHNELSGRENVYLNGAILGMKRSEIKKRFDEIVQFAEVERFIDTPVKRYSSGMYLRLAFAVAAHLEPDVLIVDEVLAVGDAAFQKKCLGKMGDVAGSGRTVLFVSHNMGAIRSLCQRALVLDHGHIVFDGSASDGVEAYMTKAGALEPGGAVEWPSGDPEQPAGEEIVVRRVAAVGPGGAPQGIHQTSSPIRIDVDYEVLRPVRGIRIVLSVLTQEGELAFMTTDHAMRPTFETPGTYRSTAVIPGNLLNRRSYLIRLSFEMPGVRYLIPARDYLSFVVDGPGTHGSHFPEPWDGVASPLIDWTLQPLPGEGRGDDVSPLPSDDREHDAASP